jgi:hypothetical protein
VIVVALLLASAASPAPQGTTPFASMAVMSSLPRAPQGAGQSCAEPITVEVSVTLAPEGKVESVAVSPVECDQGLEQRLTGWITGLPAASFRSVAKATQYSFRLHFIPEPPRG